MLLGTVDCLLYLTPTTRARNVNNSVFLFGSSAKNSTAIFNFFLLANNFFSNLFLKLFIEGLSMVNSVEGGLGSSCDFCCWLIMA